MMATPDRLAALAALRAALNEADAAYRDAIEKAYGVESPRSMADLAAMNGANAAALDAAEMAYLTSVTAFIRCRGEAAMTQPASSRRTYEPPWFRRGATAHHSPQR
jgi:hypothetical protein